MVTMFWKCGSAQARAARAAGCAFGFVSPGAVGADRTAQALDVDGQALSHTTESETTDNFVANSALITINWSNIRAFEFGDNAGTASLEVSLGMVRSDFGASVSWRWIGGAWRAFINESDQGGFSSDRDAFLGFAIDGSNGNVRMYVNDFALTLSEDAFSPSDSFYIFKEVNQGNETISEGDASSTTVRTDSAVIQGSYDLDGAATSLCNQALGD